MHRQLLFLFSVFILCVAPLQADKLCLKKTQKVVRGKVRLSKILRTNTECPNRFTEILDTAIFKGEVGASGAKGEKGESGSKGDAGVNVTTQLSSITTEQTGDVASDLDVGITRQFEAGCAGSRIVVGGGCHINDTALNLTRSYLNSQTGRWRCEYTNNSTGPILSKITVIATCANI